jgi:hypothetical protein
MAIRQVVPVSITLVGDRSAASFAFKLADVLGINHAGKGLIINPRAIPAMIEGTVIEMPNNVVTATAASNGIITVSFHEPLPADVPSTLNMKFYFDSLGAPIEKKK